MPTLVNGLPPGDLSTYAQLSGIGLVFVCFLVCLFTMRAQVLAADRRTDRLVDVLLTSVLQQNARLAGADAVQQNELDSHKAQLDATRATVNAIAQKVGESPPEPPPAAL